MGESQVGRRMEGPYLLCPRYAHLLTPYMSSVPAVIAKASAIHNPIIYAIIHPKYRCGPSPGLQGPTYGHGRPGPADAAEVCRLSCLLYAQWVGAVSCQEKAATVGGVWSWYDPLLSQFPRGLFGGISSLLGWCPILIRGSLELGHKASRWQLSIAAPAKTRLQTPMPGENPAGSTWLHLKGPSRSLRW